MSLNFEWSLKPVLVLMRIMLGIDIHPQSSTRPSTSNICCRISRAFFGFLVLVFTIVFNVVHLVSTIDSTYDTLQENSIFLNLTQSNLLIIRITAFNEMVFNVVIYLLFYAVVMTNVWKSLWSTFQQLQLQPPKFDRDFYHSCRKITIAAMFCILVVSYCVQAVGYIIISL